jgi:Raf kinase inhibitor-like YbhB/YbcL family protein
MAAEVAGLLGLFATFGCSREDPLPAEDPSRLTIQLHSPAFSDGGIIPKAFTCDGSDRSPPLEWSGVPAEAHSLALICDDPDASMGTWSHWVLFNLSPRLRALEPGIPGQEAVVISAPGGSEPPSPASSSARHAKNDFGKFGYGGPCPPSGTHRYFFRLYALDRSLELSSSADRRGVLQAIKGHILAEGRLMGRYSRTR